jgi:hypothetical protein
VEIIGLLEWSLPAPWRAQFDLDGYIPTLHSKIRLIEACEAIEMNELVLETSKSKEENSHSDKTVKRISAKASSNPGENQKHNSSKKHYCIERGSNPTHSTADCWTLQNCAKPAGQVSKDKLAFSNKHLRNDINLLAKKSSKRKVLDMYASIINREHSMLGKNSAKRKKADQPESDSDDDISVNVITSQKRVVAKTSRKKSNESSDILSEEKEYQKKLQWLKDHGDMTGDKEKTQEQALLMNLPPTD